MAHVSRRAGQITVRQSQAHLVMRLADAPSELGRAKLQRGMIRPKTYLSPKLGPRPNINLCKMLTGDKHDQGPTQFFFGPKNPLQINLVVTHWEMFNDKGRGTCYVCYNLQLTSPLELSKWACLWIAFHPKFWIVQFERMGKHKFERR